MNIRKLAVVVAFAAFVAPFAANADAPSGDFDELFPQSMNADEPQFPRSEYKAYVENWLDEQLAANEKFPKSRDEVLQELAASPLEVVGA
jgi:hypothetical protein